MSTVRMCDRCGTIFSEREDGWSTMVGTTMRRNERGELRPASENLDACPRCSAGVDVPRPTLALDDPWAVPQPAARARPEPKQEPAEQ